MPKQPNVPFCQSCGMLMETPVDFGTDKDGSRIIDYCHFCFNKGGFTDPDLTMEQMIEKVVGIMVTKMNMPETKARLIANGLFPKLKRWKVKQ